MHSSQCGYACASTDSTASRSASERRVAHRHQEGHLGPRGKSLHEPLHSLQVIPREGVVEASHLV